MKWSDPRLRTLLLAHAAGSFCAYFPPLSERSWQDLRWDWIAIIILAPVSVPLYLPALTVLHLIQYYSFEPQRWDYRFMPLTWVCYTIPFLLVCLIRRKKAPVWKLAIALVVMTLFVATLWLHAAIVTSIPWRSPLEGKPAPDLALTTLAGDTFRMSQERGHVVLINFWATWCPPCKLELKEMIAKLADDTALHERGLRVWTIDGEEDADSVRKFMGENHYDFNVILDPKKVTATRYPIYGIPTTYVIARDGTVRKAFLGYAPEKLWAEIDAALK
jgi:cytochrome c biogenesis protein CcmG, thiol:disulfide interchange protein DsbE